MKYLFAVILTVFLVTYMQPAQACNAQCAASGGISGSYGGSGSKSGKSGSGSKNDKAGSGVTWSKSKYDTRGLGYSAWSRHHYN